MRTLAIGDVCGSIGCAALLKFLPLLKKEKNIDFVIVNGENSADGNGITPDSAESIFCAGADVITGGNHTMHRREIHTALDENPYLLRPDNLPVNYGKGYCFVDLGRTTAAVINLSGQIYLENQKAENPFLRADELLEKAKADGAVHIFVDFHAEATSEKRALGIYLDGKITGFFGTHTHVQTSDLQILPKSTGYITDLGMTGTIDSVLGVESSIIIDRLRNGKTDKFRLSEGICMINGCIFESDKDGKVIKTEQIYIREE